MSDDLPPPSVSTVPLTPAGTHLSPLSIQASALVRSIDALSTIFWFVIGGAFLSVFFAGLMLLEGNARSDYLYLGEYQVPKAILPLTSAGFAGFVFWLIGNRLKMLLYVLSRSEFPDTVVRDLFRLNPPLFSVFSRDNYNRWSPGNGVAVLILIWGIYYGNSVAIALRSALQASATSSLFDVGALITHGGMLLLTMAYGVFALSRPLAAINQELHGKAFKTGWQRFSYGVLLAVAVVGFNNAAEFDGAEQDDDLLGPAIANAIDGGTLYMNGTRVALIGVRPLAVEQICQDANGADYPCGREARQFLQALVHNTPVVCAPLFSAGRNRVAAACQLVRNDVPIPTEFGAFFDNAGLSNLSQRVIASGHGLVSGIGSDRLGGLEEAAQRARLGLWQGSFDPNYTAR